MRTAQNSQKIMTTKITVTALLTAVAIALQYIEVPIPLVPSFLKLDFSDLPELIGAFVLGPQYGIIICLLKVQCLSANFQTLYSVLFLYLLQALFISITKLKKAL